MTLADICYFQTPDGQAFLQEASEIPGDDLAVLTHLRKSHPPDQCRRAVHLLALRKRAQSKFSRAHEMFFDREGLEQASGEIISGHRAQRYKNASRIVELCCGIGGDTIGLSQIADVIPIDSNPDRLALTRWNASIYNPPNRIFPICADAATYLPTCDALFMDPGRRSGNRRLYALSDYHPPVRLSHLQSVTSDIGIKVAPGLPESDIPPGCEVEFISESGTCKEAVLWFGALKTEAQRRAMLLPGGHTLTDLPVAEAPVRPPGSCIGDPDPAVVRAHLIDQLAHTLNAWKLAPDVAYLSADTPISSPFMRWHAVIDVLPFQLKRLQRYLSEHRIGRLDIKKRHFPLTPEALRAKLKLKGDRWVVLFLTRINNRPTAIICHPPSD